MIFHTYLPLLHVALNVTAIIIIYQLLSAQLHNVADEIREDQKKIFQLFSEENRMLKNKITQIEDGVRRLELDKDGWRNKL
jgi:hypothetical protein